VIDTASISVATIHRDGIARVLLVNDTADLSRFAPGGGSPARQDIEAPRAERRPGRNLRG
jgi:hypothetical protein